MVGGVGEAGGGVEGVFGEEGCEIVRGGGMSGGFEKLGWLVC